MGSIYHPALLGTGQAHNKWLSHYIVIINSAHKYSQACFRAAFQAFDFRFFWLHAIPAVAVASLSAIPPLEALLSQCLLEKQVLNQGAVGKPVALCLK